MNCARKVSPPGKRVHTGLGVFIIKDGKTLVGIRKGSHGAGCVSLPGGHQEFLESWKECAEWECLEETTMTVRFRILDPAMDQEYAFVTDNPMPECDKHYTTVFVVADWVSGEPRVTPEERHKLEGEWRWVSFHELLDLLPPDMVQAWKEGRWHDGMHWLPLRKIAAWREKIGLML